MLVAPEDVPVAPTGLVPPVNWVRVSVQVVVSVWVKLLTPPRLEQEALSVTTLPGEENVVVSVTVSVTVAGPTKVVSVVVE